MRPILKYPGAKWRLADWIIERMPPHMGYKEEHLPNENYCFCGGKLWDKEG